jgi:DNA repair protein RadC
MALQRILREGPASLCDEELVRAVLGEPDCILPARLLSRGLPALGRATAGELLFHSGMKAQNAARLLASIELGRRVAFAPSSERPRLLRAADLAQVLWGKLATLGREEFWVVLLNARLQEIDTVRIATGGITQCSVAPREAFAPAILQQAPAVAFAHNHPSGDPTPSAEDHRLELLLGEAGQALGIRIVDHLVVAQSGVHSAVEGRGPPVSFVPREGVG